MQIVREKRKKEDKKNGNGTREIYTVLGMDKSKKSNRLYNDNLFVC